MKALVISENIDIARELCAGARKLAEEVVLVAFGPEPYANMADTVLTITIPAGSIMDDAYETVNAIADEQKPQFVLAQSSVRVLSLVGRLAAHLGTAAITDVFAIENAAGTALFFGGAGERTAKATGETAIFTVGQGVFDGAEATGAGTPEEIAFKAPAVAVKSVSSEVLVKSDVNLAAANIVVGAGRGFAAKEELGMARELCEKIGGELGCSRPLTEGVDWLPSETYIGVSGLMLAPKVYVACGISGQVQHMVGVNRAGAIFAINKDKNAPIFKQCDYGLIGDIKEVLPALTAAL